MRTSLQRFLSALLVLLAPVVSAQPLITSIVETGGDNEATDTITAKWSGQTFLITINNEPVPGAVANGVNTYTVPLWGAVQPAFVDRNHHLTNAFPVPMPSYLIGGEYIMSGNDNRDNNPGYRLDVTVSKPVVVYMLIDNRMGPATEPTADPNNPPTFGPGAMQWILDEGWAPVTTGANRAGNPALPDEIGIDEGADGGINQYYSIYKKQFPAGTFQLKQPDNAGRNMYSAVVVAAPSELKNTLNIGNNKIGTVTDNGSGSFTIVGGGNDIWDDRDEFTYQYTEVTGDFDVQVRVESLTPNARWSKAGLMARESLSEYGRMAFARVTPADVPTSSGGNGANDHIFAYRTGLDNSAGPSGGQHEDRDGGNTIPNPNYPNAWLRLVRSGNVISSSNSLDGVTWQYVSQQDTATWGGGAMPATLYLGLAVSRHSGGPNATAEFRDFKFNYTYDQLAPNGVFNMVGASSRGNPTGVRVSFNHPPGDGTLNPAKYHLTRVSGPNVTVVTGLRFTTANDAPARDPMTFTLEGSASSDPSSGPWTLIASGNTGLDTARFATAPDVTFANAAPYRSYRLLFPTVRDAASANSMQIGEIAFLDAGANDVTAPGDAVIGVRAVAGNNASEMAAVGTAGGVNNHPAGETPAMTIDNNNNTKYLNFAELNTGIIVTPAGGAPAADPVVLAAAAGPTPGTIQLTTTPLVEGTAYHVEGDFDLKDAGGNELFNTGADFTHGQGYEARRIHIHHSKTADSGYYQLSDAVRKGLGSVVHTGDNPAGFPGTEGNTLFEDPIADTGGNERFSTRISGILNITASGNYTFYHSSDDVGFTYISTDASPANKVQIAREPAWNGRREYITGGNQASRGTPPSNISTPQALLAGQQYYLETIFTEGGGGNNGSCAWQPPGGPAVANGSAPIPDSAFVPSRLFAGEIFGSLGPVLIARQPADLTVSALLSATFSVKVDGTPGYTYQWRRNGVAIPGATGPSYTLPVAQPSDDGALFSVVAANEFSSATSANARLTVLTPQPPHLVSASADTTFSRVTVTFDNRLQVSSAENPANYAIPGVVISSATRGASGRTVTLQTSPLAEGTTYTLTVSNVRDETGTTVQDPNPAMVNFSTLAFSPGYILKQFTTQFSGGNVDPFIAAHRAGTVTYQLECLTNLYEFNAGNSADNYGGHMVGYFVPAVSGDYVFYFAADDPGRLFLSTDANPANAVQIASEPVWAGRREWTGEGSGNNRGGTMPNISTPKNLTAGQRYFIESFFTEGGGGDHMAVAVQGPGDPVPVNGSSPITAFNLGTYASPAGASVVITQQPQNANIAENATATFTVTANGTSPACGGFLNYQWRKDGVPILGANGPSYTFGPATLADDNAMFSCVVSVPGASVASANARLGVSSDADGPLLVSAGGSATFDRVSVVFNELILPGPANDSFNYTVSDGVNNLTISAAALNGDGRSVTLTLDPGTPLLEDTVYTVRVENIVDLVNNPLQQPNTVMFRSFIVTDCAGVLFEAFNVGGGNAVSVLTSHPSYPNSPDFRTVINTMDIRVAVDPNNPTFYNTDAREAYGGRLRALFIAPESGPHTFFFAADDNGEFYLSSDHRPSNKTRVAQETVWSSSKEWTVSGGGSLLTAGGKRSAPINLVAGRAYYMEALYKEGGGGDNCAVAVQPPSQMNPPANGADAIPGSLLGRAAPAGIVGNVTISQQPASQSVFANSLVTFTVVAAAPTIEDFPIPVCYQWCRDGAPIAGANGASYSFGPVGPGDNGARFSCKVSIIGSRATSQDAVLTVMSDTTNPSCVSASPALNLSNIVVRFSEFVKDAAVVDTFNYSVPGFQVIAAVLNADGMSATITLDGSMTPDNSYSVSIQNVTDLADNPISPNPCTLSFRSPVVSCGFALQELYFGIGGVAVADLRNNAAFPNSPNQRSYAGLLEGPNNSADNYGARLTGYLIPPISGNYNFWYSADDGGEFLLSTDSNPANLTLICFEPQWNGIRDWNGTARRNAAAPENRSSTLFPGGVPLVAGQPYFFEMVYKEGGGGDNGAVAWQIPGEAAPLNGSSPIPGIYMAALADPAGASIAFNRQPCPNNICLQIPGVPLPPAVGTPLSSQDFNSNDGGCTVINNRIFEGPWTYDPGTGSWKTAGQQAAIGAPGPSTRLTCPPVTVTAGGNVRVSFAHRHSFEAGRWDGGQLQVSINGGAFETVATPAFVQNGYNGTMAVNNSELGGQLAWVENSAGYDTGTFITSTADLGCFSPGNTIAVRFLASNDDNTRQNNPAWEITSVSFEQAVTGGGNANFAVGVTATTAGNPNPPIFYQWQKRSAGGGAYVNISGANGSSLSFAPTLANDGECYRAVIYIPGAVATSDVACLTVNQPNTPPRFTVNAPADCANEDGGAQNIPGVVTGVSPHSITRVPVAYANDFESGPAGMTLAGIAAVRNGHLEITTPINSSYGAASIAAPAQNFESLDIRWKSYLGDGGGGGADGYSLSVGEDVPPDPGYGGEEGTGTGLIVTVDTFDNGAGLDPCLTGVEIKWRGAVLTCTNIPKDNTGDGRYLRKSAFVDAHLTVNAGGLVTLNYDNEIVSAQIPGYAGVRASRALFWGRTGGANDNQWVDDFALTAFPFDASSAEVGQQVKFLVSNNNEALFSVQPAIDANGTLTYTPAPNACGQATVTVIAMDDGGTECSGTDMSAAQTFVICVNAVNDPPVAVDLNYSLANCSPIAVTLAGSDPDAEGNCPAPGPLAYMVTSNPAKGSLSGTAPNLTYTPNPDASGQDQFRYVVNDGTANSAEATVRITVTGCVANQCPTARITVAPDCVVANIQPPLIISLDGSNACLVLDGSLSMDADGDPLTFWWYLDDSPMPFATGPVVTNCFPVGEHKVTLVVDDGKCTTGGGMDMVRFEVDTGCVAVEALIDEVNNSTLSRKEKRPLISTLKKACSEFERAVGKKKHKPDDKHIEHAIKKLEEFQKKLKKIERDDPTLAALWRAQAQAIIDASECALALDEILDPDSTTKPPTHTNTRP